MNEGTQNDHTKQPDFEDTHSIELGRALAQRYTSRLPTLLEGVRRNVGQRPDTPNFRLTSPQETRFPNLTDTRSLVTDEYLFTMFPTSFADEAEVFLEAWSGRTPYESNLYDTSLASKFQAAKRTLQRGFAHRVGGGKPELPVWFCTVSRVPRERVNLALFEEDPQRWRTAVARQRTIRDLQWDIQFSPTTRKPISIRFYKNPHTRDAHVQDMAKINLVNGEIRIIGEVHGLTGGYYKNKNGILHRENADNWDVPAPAPMPYVDFVGNILGKFPKEVLGI